jgi:hypothetical protein
MIAVLCCHQNSIYHTMPGLDCYDISRDVRTFAGGVPVVAHPPCRSWSAFCRHQAKPLLGEKELGPLCVDWLRECGGVLEHPAHSTLWDYCKLPKPGEPERDGLYSLAVQQSWWGDSLAKNTWLLFSKVERDRLPEIPFTLRYSHGDRRTWQLMSKKQRAATPAAFAEWLVEVARMVEIEQAPTPTGE